MRRHSLIALLVVCTFVEFNQLSSVHNAEAVGNRQDE